MVCIFPPVQLDVRRGVAVTWRDLHEETRAPPVGRGGQRELPEERTTTRQGAVRALTSLPSRVVHDPLVPGNGLITMSVQCCFRSAEVVRTIRDMMPGMSTSVLHSSWSLILVVRVQRFFTSTETVGTIRDGEPSTSTSTFTQPLSSGFGSSSSVLLFVYGDCTDY